MARRRFFVGEVREGRADVSGEEAHHLARVLRAEAGQRYEITDGAAVYLAEITEVARARVSFRVLEPLPAAPVALRVTLFASLVKFDRFEWIVEKATELGAEAIVPVAAARSEKGLLAAAAKRTERWRKIAREAGRQSRAVRVPEIGGAVPLKAVSGNGFDACFLLDEDPHAAPLLTALPANRDPQDRVALLVGPEGGWTAAERDACVAAGWLAVSISPRVLRAETAAVAGLAVLLNAWPSGPRITATMEE